VYICLKTNGTYTIANIISSKNGNTNLDIQDGGDRHFECVHYAFSTSSMCSDRSPNVSTNFVTIGEIVKKWQKFFEIQDDGGRHLELWLLRLFDVTYVFEIKAVIFLLNLAMIGQIVKKRQQFFEIQDGGSHHLEKYNSG